MARAKKLIQRLKTRPADFRWEEMVRLLESLGYREVNSSGSRRSFEGENLPRIKVHKPHPSNIMKRYALNLIIEKLENEELI